jgi:hypothetical protein
MIMEIKINNRNFNVKTVITSKDTQQGMMSKNFDNNFNGMLFLMSEGDHCFWMKDCIVHLDIIFIDGNKITKIHHNCPPCKKEPCENYCGYSDSILELPGGTCKKYDIREGDIVNF